MRTAVAVALGLSACTEYVEPDARDLDAARFAVVDGTPQALGMLALVNDATATVTLLDVDVALDSRAASGIVAHRDGPDGKYGTADDDRFDTIAELDAVYYVGDSALTAILDYASAHGFVATDPDDVLGTWDNVTFTLGESELVLAQVNGATYEALDVAAALDKRAVDAIVAARPVDTMPELAGLSYVGTSALGKLKDYAIAQANPVWSTQEVVDGLTATTPGVWFPSESDYPLDPIVADGAYPVTSATVADALAAVAPAPLDGLSVEERTVDQALGFLVTPEDWWTEYEYERAAQWDAILGVMDHLEGVQVYRFGTIHIEVYVIGGSAEGDLVGFHTVSIET